MKTADVVIIGGGPAGLAAAASAKEAGAEHVLVIERNNELGGILTQCIHNGFGLHTFGEELTGPEYADRFIKKSTEAGTEFLLNTMVLDISGDRIVTAMNGTDGLFQVKAGAVILAMGCRERPRGALNIPGSRPSGIYTAGTAQRLINIEGMMPGKEVVILGSGDIGLIMARRMTLEGAHVNAVVELMPYSTGLRRNIVQCLDDFNIPLLLSHTVIRTEGKEHLQGVTVAEVGPDRKPVPGTEIHYDCDCLLLSCGLIPENELSRNAGVKINPITNGPVVDDTFETSIPGVFSCGNVLHVHDLVDFVSEEAGKAGRFAALYAQAEKDGKLAAAEKEVLTEEGKSADGAAASAEEVRAADRKLRGSHAVQVAGEGGVRYTVPSDIYTDTMDGKVTVRFRVGKVYKGAYLSVYADDQRIFHQKKKILTPGEMCQVMLTKDKLSAMPERKRLTVKIEEE